MGDRSNWVLVYSCGLSVFRNQGKCRKDSNRALYCAGQMWILHQATGKSKPKLWLRNTHRLTSLVPWSQTRRGVRFGQPSHLIIVGFLVKVDGQNLGSIEQGQHSNTDMNHETLVGSLLGPVFHGWLYNNNANNNKDNNNKDNNNNAGIYSNYRIPYIEYVIYIKSKYQQITIILPILLSLLRDGYQPLTMKFSTTKYHPEEKELQLLWFWKQPSFNGEKWTRWKTQNNLREITKDMPWHAKGNNPKNENPNHKLWAVALSKVFEICTLKDLYKDSKFSCITHSARGPWNKPE